MPQPDWSAFRAQFPVTERYCYLNNAGVAPMSLAAATAVRSWADEMLHHGAARYSQLYAGIVQARRTCARLVGAAPEEIAFVANTSDGLSLVANGLEWKPGDRILVPDLEFPANVYPWLSLAERKGVVVERIPFVDGRCPPEQIEARLPGARLLSLSAVSFANGFRYDLAAVGDLCRKHGVLFCVDGIQALGAIPVDVRRAKIDFLAADGHKWMTGPEGLGLFYVARERMPELYPSKIGWSNVANPLEFSTIDFRLRDDAGRYEEGTPNVGGILGLGAALEALLAVGIETIHARILALTDRLVSELPALGYRVRSPRAGADRSGIVSFLGDADDAARMAKASEAGIVIAYRGGALRASPHAFNDDADLDRLLAFLRDHRPV